VKYSVHFIKDVYKKMNPLLSFLLTGKAASYRSQPSQDNREQDETYLVDGKQCRQVSSNS
jgi:hypothetical protein